MQAEKTLAELSDESGVPARTIRFYIARGLLARPAKAGRGALYTAAHLERLERIQALQAEGRMLSEIAALLDGGPPPADTAPPTAWWQHAVAPDVYVMARADLSPWRMKQVRAAIQHLAALLDEPGRTK
jgi:DNA-binding transcriptional MerR regulator